VVGVLDGLGVVALLVVLVMLGGFLVVLGRLAVVFCCGVAGYGSVSSFRGLAKAVGAGASGAPGFETSWPSVRTLRHRSGDR